MAQAPLEFFSFAFWKGRSRQALYVLAMSTASKVTLAVTTLGAIGIVVSVHYGQKAERAVSLIRICCHSTSHHFQAMHAGVIRDMEQQKLKRERQLDFDMQRALEKEYRKVQTVKDTTKDAPAPNAG
jgi:protein PET117